MIRLTDERSCFHIQTVQEIDGQEKASIEGDEKWDSDEYLDSDEDDEGTEEGEDGEDDGRYRLKHRSHVS